MAFLIILADVFCFMTLPPLLPSKAEADNPPELFQPEADIHLLKNEEETRDLYRDVYKRQDIQ